ncbi:lysophospholipid acyltransferase family protein [Algihabitans albus]|uniref:lysophospholipid acyltransferase family protein n=1 Tax=Algihabitans albus TaxID=2164067 RepID=UPI000E5CB419|nr:lauroyl acyltransferase [Algihabitans albus]
MVWGAEYAFLSAFWGICSLLPPRVASAIGHRLVWSYAPRLSKFRHSVRNLSIAFPNKSQEEIAALARQSWAATGRVLAEYPHVGRICAGSADEGPEMLVDSEVEDLVRDGKPIMFVTAHIANWEIAAGAIAHRLGLPLSVVYSPQQNPYIADRVLRMRRGLACELIEKRKSIRGSLAALSKGRSIGMLIDTRSDEGELVPFFGIDAMTSLVPARLALRTKVPMVPVRVERREGASFRVHLMKPIRVSAEARDEHEAARALTQDILSHYEAWITERPGDWLCSKRRWPKDITRRAASDAPA